MFVLEALQLPAKALCQRATPCASRSRCAVHRRSPSMLVVAAVLATSSVVQALDVATVLDATRDASGVPEAGTPTLPVKLQPVTEHSTEPLAKLSLRRQKTQKKTEMAPSMVQANVSAVNDKNIRPASLADSKTGFFLTPMELSRINTIDCLQLKIKDPFVNCTTENIGYISDYEMNAANYPSWKDPACRSNGEFFCDPDRLLTDNERLGLTTMLKKLRSKSAVLCSDRDPIDRWHYQPFYVGVALAKEWPLHLSDSETLQLFGRMLAARWNMSFPWDGSPLPFSRCPNEGMLIVLPKQKQVFLSTASCEFLCESRGGPEVVTAMSYALRSGGVAAGVEAGLKAIYAIVNKTTPGTADLVPSPQLTDWVDESPNIVLPGMAPTSTKDWSLIAWNTFFRVVYAISIVVMAASIVVAILVCLLAPGLIQKITKSNV